MLAGRPGNTSKTRARDKLNLRTRLPGAPQRRILAGMSTSGPSVIVSGAGPAGLAAACLVAEAGLEVRLITGPKPSSGQRDPRTIAVMQSSLKALEHIGVWPGNLRPVAQPLRKLRLIDDTGHVFSAPTVTFSAEEAGQEAFGWNIPVEELISALKGRALARGVHFVQASARGLRISERTVQVSLDTGDDLTASVVIAADGQASPLRRAADIRTVNWSYEQTAIAASFAHSAPHNDLSCEYHKHAGPLTTVPMPQGRSALVWLERPERADELMSMEDNNFARVLQCETHGDLGLISDPGARRAFPMRGLTALKFAHSRVMLVGEAAHVVPPIGAQGLNMSLRDAALAAELIGDAAAWDEDVGGDKVMASYDSRRRADVAPRQAVIHGMNTSLLSEFSVLHGLRAAGIGLVDKFKPLRDLVMQQGLAPGGNLPRIMQG